MPPASAVHRVNPDINRGEGLTLILGTEYEKKKQKLLQELQLDYKHYISQKTQVNVSKRLSQTPSLPLPIDEHLSAKEKLREERKKEYNTFLHEKAQISGSKNTPLTTKPEQRQSTDAALLVLNTQAKTNTAQTQRPSSRRDAATLTEAVENTKNRRTWDRSERRRKRWLLYRPVELSSEEELFKDEEEEVELDLGPRRKNADTSQSEERRMGKSSAPHEVKETETSGGQDQKSIYLDVKPDLLKSDVSARPGPDVRNNKTEFATGLLIGSAVEQPNTQLRKEQYKQELLKQMEEEQRNKMKEKKLELRVAATGATDPEKKPDRIKQFGVIRPTGHNTDLLDKLQQVVFREDLIPKDQRLGENTEKRCSPEELQVKHFTEPGAEEKPGLDFSHEDYHRDITQMLREVAIPRAAGVPPAPPPPLSVPSVSKNYTTPYDAAYYYFGARNPLDPNNQHYLNESSGLVQQPVSLQNSPEEPSPTRPEPLVMSAMSPPVLAGEFSVDVSKRRRENALHYQEALKQQIKEREEQRRREKEERERYDARMEAEMTVYNPWGRSGGGAPIKDQKGNLFSDLNQMHRINEETYKNPDSKNTEQRQSLDGEFSESAVKATSSPLLSAFNDPQGPMQLHMQNRYKEELKQQIEENKRKQMEERERMKVEEEKEERRLAAQRIRIQWEYEEEQRRQKMIEMKLDNHSWINAPKTCHQKEEKVEEVKEEQNTKKMTPESSKNIEENKLPVMFERKSSPPVPAIQKKRSNLVLSRPASTVSHLSTRTLSQRSVSAPHYPSVPAGTFKPHDGHSEVIRQLSALRTVLRKEQKQLEGQMDKRDGQELLHNPLHRHRRRHIVESSQREAGQPSAAAQRYPVPAHVHRQNIMEFNRLKYRDSSSREEVIHMYPDPPIDDQSLDIQQQALLREQRRKLKLMKGKEDTDLLDLQLSHYYPRRRAEQSVHRDSVLPSETTFIDVYSDGDFEGRSHRQRSPPTPAEHPERTATRRRHRSDISVNQQECGSSTNTLNSARLSTSPNTEPVVRGSRRQISGQQSNKSETLTAADEKEDPLSLSPALERHSSVDSIATDAWLRPGTSSAVKRSVCREREKPLSREEHPRWLTYNVR